MHTSGLARAERLAKHASGIDAASCSDYELAADWCAHVFFCYVLALSPTRQHFVYRAVHMVAYAFHALECCDAKIHRSCTWKLHRYMV